MSAVSNVLSHPGLIPGIPDDVARSVIGYLDLETLRVLPEVNRTWNAEPDVKLHINGAEFEERIPKIYADALKNSERPIRNLPRIDLRDKASISPPIVTPDPIIRGEFDGNVPYIQIRVKGRPDSQVSYQLHSMLPATNVRDMESWILIYRRYKDQPIFYAIAGDQLESAVKVRHGLEANHSRFICLCANPAPIKNASIEPTWLQGLLAGHDPDFHVV